MSPSSLRRHISHVIDVRAEEKMRLVAARWIIAFVQNVLAGRNRAISLNPSQASNKPSFAPPSEVTVALRTSPHPRPAGIRPAALVGVVVKALRKRPMRWTTESFIGGLSHFACSFSAAMVRAASRATTRLQPAFSTIPSALAKGVSP
jgi:hypothetical protein